MTLLAILAASQVAPVEPDPTDPADPNPTEPGVPYALPLVAPYNVDDLCPIPTPDGYGQTVHPDVLDFGSTGWNGHRYWMGVTPFAGGDPRLENPCVYVSDNGYAWESPEGLVNPLDPGPGAVFHANSDTDLIYDPEADRIILYWRLYHTGTRMEIIKARTSTDGVTWTPTVEVLRSDGSVETGNGGGVQQITSPAIVRVSATDYRMFTIHGAISGATGDPSRSDKMWTATAPEGPWVNPTPVTYTGATNRRTGQPWDPYHADVIVGPDGRFWMLGQASGELFPAVSTDGVTWTTGPALLAGRNGRWDQGPYRATMTAHENGTHMRMWYSSLYDDGVKPEGLYSSQDWWTGYTWVKRDHWTSL